MRNPVKRSRFSTLKMLLNHDDRFVSVCLLSINGVVSSAAMMNAAFTNCSFQTKKTNVN